jgi:hypothetical protein
MYQAKLCLSILFVILQANIFSSEASGAVLRDETSSSTQYIVDSFKAIAAKGFNWDHILENHSAAGKVAK